MTEVEKFETAIFDFGIGETCGYFGLQKDGSFAKILQTKFIDKKHIFDKVTKNKVHLCNSCSKIYPECGSKNIFIGKGDTINSCDSYEPINMVPGIDRLNDRLIAGCEIEWQEEKFILFDNNDESIASGETLRKLIVNLIFIDC